MAVKKAEKSDSNLIAAVAYLLGIWAIVIYLLKKEDDYVKFHSLQAILFNLAVGVLAVGFMIFGMLTLGLGMILLPVFILGVVIAWAYAVYKAFQGERFKLPVIGDLAEQYAK